MKLGKLYDLPHADSQFFRFLRPIAVESPNHIPIIRVPTQRTARDRDGLHRAAHQVDVGRASTPSEPFDGPARGSDTHRRTRGGVGE
jgi:hypothetical protein